MTIKITGLELVKEEIPLYKKESITEIEDYHIKLEGNLGITVTQNNITASAHHSLNKVSKSAKDNLINAIKLIEDELNGVKTSFTQSDSVTGGRPTKDEGALFGGKVNFEDATVKLPKGEKLLNKDEAEKVLKASNILNDIMKNISPAIDKLHEIDSDKEIDTVSKALDEAEKVFNFIFNVSKPNNKSASELVDEVAKAMKTKGEW